MIDKDDTSFSSLYDDYMAGILGTIPINDFLDSNKVTVYALWSYFRIYAWELYILVNNYKGCRFTSDNCLEFDDNFKDILKIWYASSTQVGGAYRELGFYNFMTALGLLERGDIK